MIDREALKARCGGDEGVLRELLQDFTSRCDEEAARISKPGANLHSHAHRIKGLALNLSMPELQEAAAQLESSARDGAPPREQVDRVLRELHAACREARDILGEERE